MKNKQMKRIKKKKGGRNKNQREKRVNRFRKK